MRTIAFSCLGLVVACGNDTPASTHSITDSGITTLADGAKVTADGSLAPPGDSGPANGKSPNVASCDIFRADNAWNQDVSKLAVSKDNAMYLGTMNGSTSVHPDWGTFKEEYGIPITTGTGSPPIKIDWTTKYGSTESDKLACPNNGGEFCYPIPNTAKIEGGSAAKPTSDRHILYLDTAGAPSSCTLYELYQAANWTGPDWSAASGAIWHLGSNALRTEGWTSADAAGLPVMPGLVRYDEVKAGEIRHAIRFTMNTTQQAWIHPATHAAGDADATLPPMGLRLRLKSGTAVTKPSAEASVIVTALVKYGIILADNGSDWYISGETNDGWGTSVGNGDTVMDGIIHALGQLKGSDFEVVDTGPIVGH